MDTQTTALLSGLVGALVTGGLSYLVRRTLDKKAREESQQRLAYVYLVRLSEIIATEIVVKSTLQAWLGKDIEEKLGADDKSFDMSHTICTLLAKGLKDAPLNDSESAAGLKGISQHFRSMLSYAKESRLSPEQLSKLPREAVYTGHQFQRSHDGMINIVELWCYYFEDPESDFWVTPEGLHDQWRSVQKFLDHARMLRVALIAYGAANHAQADALLRQQVTDIDEMVMARFKNAAPLSAALKSYEESQEDQEKDEKG